MTDRANLHEKNLFSLSLVFVLLILFTQKSFACADPEHRQIALFPIQNLSPAYRVLLDQYWKIARTGFTNRLTESVIDTLQGIKPKQLVYTSWAAIAGHHSCSPGDMLNSVLYSEWILKVADIAAQLKVGLAKAKNSPEEISHTHILVCNA